MLLAWWARAADWMAPGCQTYTTASLSSPAAVKKVASSRNVTLRLLGRYLACTATRPGLLLLGC